MSFNRQNYRFLIGEHDNKNVIFVHFPYNIALKCELREKFPVAKWSTSKKCWYLPDNKAIRNEIGLMPKTEPGKALFSQIHPANQAALKRMLVHIESAKGKVDRYVTLPSSILDDLRNYYRAYHPKTYLFEGQYKGQYAIRSVQAVFKNAMQKAKINKTVGIHGLRHSYATHLLECGTDMFLIQKLLGHKDIKTTEIYAKVSNRQISNIKSPLDDL